MLVLGRVEQLADDAIVKVDDFIGDGGHAFDGQRYQRGIASLHLELCQISRRHLATFTSDFEQAVLVNLPLDACGQIVLADFRRSICSSMWREFGLAGDWRSHASHVTLLPSLRLRSSSGADGGVITKNRSAPRKCVGWHG